VRGKTDAMKYLNEEQGYTAKLHIELTETNQLTEVTVFRSYYYYYYYYYIVFILSKYFFSTFLNS
jgi:hypothetical protein